MTKAIDPLKTGQNNSNRIFVGAAAVMVLLSLAITRLPAPWRMDATTDEMIHISSYPDSYDSMKFLHEAAMRLKWVDKRISAENKENIKHIYGNSPFLQRVQFLLIRDAHPPIFPLIAEAVNCQRVPTLLVMRTLSVAVSLIFIFYMYLAGREYEGRLLGLWLAGIGTISLSSRAYAGIARPYVYAQAVAAIFLYAYLRRRRNAGGPLKPLLLVALLVQATDWMLWPIITPMLAASFYVRYKTVPSVRGILRESWWYLAGSVLLLVQFIVQINNPVIARHLVEQVSSAKLVWDMVSTIAPFAEAGQAWRLGTSVGSIVFFLLCIVGVVIILKNTMRGRAERCALAATMLAASILILIEPLSSRFYIVPITVLVFSAGIGARGLVRNERGSALLLSCIVLGFLVIFLVRPESPYERIFDADARYSEIADRLTTNLKPGDIWFSVPDYMAKNLYLYGAPPPLEIHDAEQMHTVLNACTTEKTCYVYTKRYDETTDVRLSVGPKQTDGVWFYANKHVLFRVPHP